MHSFVRFEALAMIMVDKILLCDEPHQFWAESNIFKALVGNRGTHFYSFPYWLWCSGLHNSWVNGCKLGFLMTTPCFPTGQCW